MKEIENSLLLSETKLVPPIVCVVCGREAPCVHRQARGTGEIQTFECRCGTIETHAVGVEESDAEIQNYIENRLQRGRI